MRRGEKRGPEEQPTPVMPFAMMGADSEPTVRRIILDVVVTSSILRTHVRSMPIFFKGNADTKCVGVPEKRSKKGGSTLTSRQARMESVSKFVIPARSSGAGRQQGSKRY